MPPESQDFTPVKLDVTGMLGPINIAKSLLDDCIYSEEDLLRIMTEPKPPREPIVQPEPSIEFSDAASALRALLEAGCEAEAGTLQDRVCFFCGSMLEYEPHWDECSYIAAKAFMDRSNPDRDAIEKAGESH